MPDFVSEFFAAIKKGDVAAVTAMLDANPSLAAARDTQGNSAVLTCAYYQQPALATLLVDYGAPLDLFEACAAGSLEKVAAILKFNPDLLNDFATDGFLPIGLAAFFGHTEIVRLLIDLDAQVNTPSRNTLKVTPLNSAAAGGRLEIARLLLEHGADPNMPQSDDFVPLHAAAQNDQIEMIELLLKFGANTALKNKEGKTALDIANKSGHPELINLLK